MSSFIKYKNQKYVLADRATADFKTAKQIFVQLGIDEGQINKYFEKFKKLRDSSKIKDPSEKNIDIWAYKARAMDWYAFVDFVEKTEKEVSKTQEKKLSKIKGAKLVAENDDWQVFKIDTHEAAMLYGSGTKWCITQPDGEHWHNYSKTSNFYFIISKNVEKLIEHMWGTESTAKTTQWAKIALQVTYDEREKYWDMLDNVHYSPWDSLPPIPKFEVETPELRADVDGDLYTMDEISRITYVEGNLNLAKMPIRYLADGLEINGYLNLEDCGYIRKLPKGLYVGKYLNVLDTNIEEIPEDAKIRGCILSDGSKLEKPVPKPISARVLGALKVLADFKTSEKKFLGQGIKKEEVKEYFDKFKKLRDSKIKSTEDKNIDNWAKKDFKDFKEFVNKLGEEKSKSQLEKETKMEGAELVAENELWKVYRITTHAAARIYGSGTKWCITEPNSEYWDNYIRENNFYFFISKLPKDSDETGEGQWYKIALSVDTNGTEVYWDAKDQSHGDLTDYRVKAGFPKFKVEIPEYKLVVDGKAMTLKEFANSKNLTINKLDLFLIPHRVTLPENLTVKGFLRITDNVASLPSGLDVGFLNMVNSKITELPPDLKVHQTLIARGARIGSLPNNLKLTGYLDLASSWVRELPENLEVDCNISLYGTFVKELPKNMKVGGDLDLSNTEIIELPENFKVGGSLDLFNVPITELPKGLIVGVGLDLRNTDITELPLDLVVGGTLNITHTRIRHVPEGLNVGRIVGFVPEDWVED